MKNKKICLIVSVIIIAILVGALIFMLIKQDSEKMPKENNEIYETLVKNNYLLSYIFNGDIKTTDGFVTIGDLTYNCVEDETLENINTIGDITKLIEETLSPEIVGNYIAYLEDENYNRYVSIEDKLYVLKKVENCESFLDYNPESIKIRETDEEDKYIISWDRGLVHVIKYDDAYYTTELAFYCISYPK